MYICKFAVGLASVGLASVGLAQVRPNYRMRMLSELNRNNITVNSDHSIVTCTCHACILVLSVSSHT